MSVNDPTNIPVVTDPFVPSLFPKFELPNAYVMHIASTLANYDKVKFNPKYKRHRKYIERAKSLISSIGSGFELERQAKYRRIVGDPRRSVSSIHIPLTRHNLFSLLSAK